MPKAHIHGLTISFAISLAWAMAAMLALAPAMLALHVSRDTTISTLVGLTIIIASVSFLAGYLHQISKQVEIIKATLAETLNTRPSPVAVNENGSSKREIVTIANSSGTKVPLPKGITKYHLLALLDAHERGEITAVSARSLDGASILSRDPQIKPNAADLVEWLAHPLHGLAVPIGNNRYELTRVGENTLKALRETPLPSYVPSPA